jgi:hypothetical protein
MHRNVPFTGNNIDYQKHPFLTGKVWCGQCAAAYYECPVKYDGEEHEVWPAGEDGSGTLCVVCGHGNKEVLVCNGPCGGYFVTCHSCVMNIMGVSEGEAERLMEEGNDDPFYCAFCRPGGRSFIRINAFKWMRRNKLFSRSIRKKWKRMEKHANKKAAGKKK